MLRQLLISLLLVGCSVNAFTTTHPSTTSNLEWSSINHKIITESGLWCSLVQFLKDNPLYVKEKKRNALNSVNTGKLREGRVSNSLYRMVLSSKLKDAVREIEDANAEVDDTDKKIAAAHFNGEQFTKSSRLLILIKRKVIALIKEAGDDADKYSTARKQAGRYLHTLQDFYSHSNWIESRNRIPLDILGDQVIPESVVAGKNQRTCLDCTPTTFAKLLGIGKDDCHNNLVHTRKFTSGYYGGQDVVKPVDVGKCSHGGFLDSSRKTAAEGGMNKDATLRYISPHYRLHNVAARVAIDATKLFFDDIRKAVGDKSYAKFLNLVVIRTLSFAIDTTGSMADEIAVVRDITINFIELAEKDDEHDFYYVLVPFNDPGVGPVIKNSDVDLVKNAVKGLTANGGGDCPELGMSGLLKAVSYSLTNTDIYYFSDASPKDAYLLSTVIAAAKVKQCRIHPIITGTCSGGRKRRSTGEQDLYMNLATSTGGQFIEISKSNIHEVTKLLRPANTTSDSVLENVVLFSAQSSTFGDKFKVFTLHVDSSIVSMKAVLTADANVDLKIGQPTGSKDEVQIILDTGTVYSVNVEKPSSGEWSFNITASGSYSFQVFAQTSSVFTIKLEKNKEGTTFPLAANPIKGEILYVTILPSEVETLRANENITGQLVDIEGSTLESFQLSQGEDFYNNSYYGSVTANKDSFMILFQAQNKNGETIQRLLQFLITPQHFEMELSTPRNELTLTPNETTSVYFILKNFGGNENFDIFALDDRNFVTNTSPKKVFVAGGGEEEIQIDLFVPFNTSNFTTTSVSVTASVSVDSATINYLTFEMTVFSEEFLYINETEVTTKVNFTDYFSVDPNDDVEPGVTDDDDDDDDDNHNDDDDDKDDGFPTYAIALIVVLVVAFLIVIAVASIILLVKRAKNAKIERSHNVPYYINTS